MSNNYYFHAGGGALPPNHPTYIERKADNELLNALKRGEFCYVLNARQMGKSSLRARTMQKLIEEGCECTCIDISQINTNDQMKWYTAFISELNNNFHLLEEEEDWIEQNKHRPSNILLTRFFTDVLLPKLTTNKIVIFLDEVDALLSKFFKDDFFAFIRSFYNLRASNAEYQRIILCLLGVITPSDLIQDKEQSFNIGQNIELKGLDRNRMQETFATELAEIVDNSQDIIQQIFGWTKGQPFLTQKLCQLVVENAENRTIDIDDLVEQNFIANWEYKSDLISVHLNNISNCILSKSRETNPVSLLVLIADILEGKKIKYNSQDPEHIQLKLSGFITVDSQGIHIFNKLYAHIFNKDWWKEQADYLPKIWFPKGDLEDIPYDSPPSKFVQWIYKRIDNNILVIALVFILIDILSLFSAYWWFSSPAWTESFDTTRQGANIELIRACILIAFTAYSIKDLFKEETKRVLTKDNLWWLRSMIVIIGFLLTVSIVYYHLYMGPMDLAKSAAKDSSTSWSFSSFWRGNYFVPYLSYLPYSLINFVILGVPLISITLYGSIYNIFIHNKGNKIVDKYLTETAKYIEDYSPISNKDQKNIQEDIRDGFARLFQQNLNYFTRYSLLFLGILFIFVCEARLGVSTLSEKAVVLTFFDYIFALVAILLILYHGLNNYRHLFKKTYNLLKGVDGNYQDFARQYNVVSFIIKVIRAMFNYTKKPYTYALIIAAIALLVFIFSVPIKK